MRRALGLLAIVFLALHLPHLPRTLEDLDSINFALGVRDFDLARHQPHPPGYPIFIALSKISTAAFRAGGMASPEAPGLAIWGVLGGALAVFPLFAFFRAVDGSPRRALAATIVTISAPLYWFTANRPMSDMAGLVAVISAQALAAMAFIRQRDPGVDAATVRRWVMAAAAVAALAIGVRAQTFTLTLPLVAWLIFDPRVPAARRAVLPAMVSGAAAGLSWAVPLLVAAGGLGAYLAVLGGQGGEDLSGVVMLFTHRTVRQAAFAARETFVLPWASLLVAVPVLALAAGGALVLAWRSRTTLMLLAAAAVPYAIFHLLFHETVTVRYALPLVPVVAYLAVVAIDAISDVAVVRPIARWLVPIAATLIAAGSLASAGPALRAYAASASPVFHALDDMAARATATGTAGVLVPHWDSKRAGEFRQEQLPGPMLAVRQKYEWLAATDYWLAGGEAPVWLLVRPGRTDLALLDPARRALAGTYRWPFDERVFVGGARPGHVDWYDVTAPGWFLGRGWALTPEIAGVTKAGGDGPHLKPSLGFLRRRPDEMLLMIGGRNLNTATSAPVHLRVDIDGRNIFEWDQPPGFFLRMHPIPAGALVGDGRFARLSVTSANAGTPIEVGLEQFDAQPAAAVVWGFDEGWNEPEYDPRKEWLWRWTSAASTLNVHNAGRDVTLHLRGESPLVYFDAPPQVTVRAGDRTIATFSPDRDFVQDIVVPADALAAAGGRLTIASSRTWVPANGDQRQLGLRLFEVSVK